jgi:hypothetical protein
MSIGGWIVFEHVSTSIIFLTFLLLNIQLISYSILMGQLFNSFVNLFVLTIIIWLSMNIIALKNLGGKCQLILCLNPFFSLIYLLRYLFLHERTMLNVNFSRRLYLWTPIFGHIFFLIIISIPIYWILIWYIEKVSPGKYFK